MESVLPNCCPIRHGYMNCFSLHQYFVTHCIYIYIFWGRHRGSCIYLISKILGKIYFCSRELDHSLTYPCFRKGAVWIHLVKHLLSLQRLWKVNG